MTTVEILRLWWYDPQKSTVVENGVNDPSVTMPIEPVEVRFWEEYNREKDDDRY